MAAVSAARTRAACLASASARLAKPERLDLRDLVGKTVAAIDAYQFGWRMRFTDGTVICVNADHTFDRAGDYVREP